MPERSRYESTSRWKVRDKRKFLLAAMTELAGEAHLSLEGDLSGTRVRDMPGASGDETATLKRNTTWPVQDFAVLPLKTGSINDIIARIGGTVPRGIIHIQIESCGKLELGIYDNCASLFFGAGLASEFVGRLERDGVLAKLNG